MADIIWWNIDINNAIQDLESDCEHGLNSQQISARQSQTNNRWEGESIRPLSILMHQFTDTMVVVLLAATVISGFIGDMVDAVTIMTIVVINAFLGFMQEFKAERSLEEIKKMASPFAVVIRGSRRLRVPAGELVPGDIVLIEAGDKVPADLRLIQAFSLEADESALTGESVPVEKSSDSICLPDCPLAERHNMVFTGTAITRGRGRGIVTATGMDTVMGEIAGMMREAAPGMTPLQLKLDQLGKVLIVICIAVCAIVTVLGIARGENALTMFMAGISLAVAAIPEGLPAIVTVVLALGVQRMAKRNAIVRKLPAVETLGCTTVICSDKTGTLTRNQMTVKKMATRDITIDMEENGSQSILKAAGRQHPKISNDKAWSTLVAIAANCNNSVLTGKDGKGGIQGDPTEAALLVMALKSGMSAKKRLLREIPFDSDRKRMSVIVDDNQPLLMMKGALDVIIPSCAYVMKDRQIRRISGEDRNYFLQLQEKWASGALRVLGFAYKSLEPETWKQQEENRLESDLILVGICGMMDPPRPGAARSVRRCLGAGIVPVMITGDHPVTAAAIAREIGISDGLAVITGKDIDSLPDEQLLQRAMRERVFARVSPQHKNRIVNVLKNGGQVVAMTGDGVNDAPAIKAADIGIAMGISGTQVSKEASSMILMDDDFSTIVQAVYEGRAIYDNIRKFIRYLLGCNIGEVLVMFLASLTGIPLPMLPIQLLWVNLVTDGLPAMALGLEPPEPGIMNRKPRPRKESIFAHGLGWVVFGRGTYIAVITLISFLIGLIGSGINGAEGLPLARSMAFTTLVFAQLFYVFECRSERYSPFELGFYTNKFLVGAVLCSVFMQLSALYIPFLQDVFKTVSLSIREWIIIILLSGVKFIWRFMLYLVQGHRSPRLSFVRLKT